MGTRSADCLLWRKTSVGARTGTYPGEDVPSGERDRDRFLLDRTWLLKAGLEDAHQEFALEAIVLEVAAFGVEDVLACGRRRAGARAEGEGGRPRRSANRKDGVRANTARRYGTDLSLRTLVAFGEVELGLPVRCGRRRWARAATRMQLRSASASA